MDSITHIVLGACIGEAVLGKNIGKKALVLGALAQSIPDFDFITSFWLSPAKQLLAHRGITHSFLFILLLSPIIAYLFHKILRKRVTIYSLTIFFLLEMLVHLFLDAFNNYGVGWFQPFNDVRVSFNTVYVADPIMIIISLIASIALLLLPMHSIKRTFWWKFSIVSTAVYLVICLFNKFYVSSQAHDSVVRQHLPHQQYFTTPAPLQSFLWLVVTGNDTGYYVGYRSVFDRNRDVQFNYFPVNENYLDTLDDHEDVRDLKKFSNGFYTVEKWGDTLVFNDLRFGQIIGWQNPKERFVFHYFLQHPEDNTLVIQRGRFARWTPREIALFLKRVMGK
jgi:inner membrane protein